MEMHEILTRLEATTARVRAYGHDGFTTLTLWDAEMPTRVRGEKTRLFIRTNIYSAKGRGAGELTVAGWDIAEMFADLDRQITRFFEADKLLAKTLGIEVAA